ncbi:hypothetical protein RG959_04985 [Domibacillus sp. 8LH]|uniref:hypothetical protein n=1 Tax=Domibacillus sp. 8LH TaxID=3073900 RepID=UPI003171C54F
MVWKINKQRLNKHFLFFKKKDTALFALYNLVTSHLAAGEKRRLLWDERAAGTVGAARRRRAQRLPHGKRSCPDAADPSPSCTPSSI